MRKKLTVAALACGLVGALGISSQVAMTPLATGVAGPVPTMTVEATALAAKVTAKKFKNCTALNKTYKHGVARKNAKDKVTGKSKPVTNFKKHDALYRANAHLDRDKDGVACEKR